MANPTAAFTGNYDVSISGDNTVVQVLQSLGAVNATAQSSSGYLSGDGDTDGDTAVTLLAPGAKGHGATDYYIGTAENSSGTVVGIVVTTGDGIYQLLTNHSYTVGTSLNLNISTGTDDPTMANYNLSTNSPVAYCFMAGTRVRTPAGDVAVETLRIGDQVTLSDGGSAAVTWMGRQSVATAFGDRLRTLPIRIKAGAFAAGLPERDLLVSPDHGLLIDGLLMQAGALVNDISIIRESRVPTHFIYHHVETAAHSLILVEGVPAETFVDNVDRMAFDNWAEHEALYGTGRTVPEMNYPRAKARRQVPAAIWDGLLARGQRLYGFEVALAS